MGVCLFDCVVNFVIRNDDRHFLWFGASSDSRTYTNNRQGDFPLADFCRSGCDAYEYRDEHPLAAGAARWFGWGITCDRGCGFSRTAPESAR